MNWPATLGLVVLLLLAGRETCAQEMRAGTSTTHLLAQPPAAPALHTSPAADVLPRWAPRPSPARTSAPSPQAPLGRTLLSILYRYNLDALTPAALHAGDPLRLHTTDGASVGLIGLESLRDARAWVLRNTTLTTERVSLRLDPLKLRCVLKVSLE